MPKTPKDNSNKPATLWLRVGDMGSYEPFGQDLDAAIETLLENGVGPVSNWVPLGFETDTHQRADYVSMYWAENFLQGPNLDLSAAEKREVERGLAGPGSHREPAISGPENGRRCEGDLSRPRT